MQSPTRHLRCLLLLLCALALIACGEDEAATPAADTGAVDPGAVQDPGPGEADPGTEPEKDEGADPGKEEQDPGPQDAGPAAPGEQDEGGDTSEDGGEAVTEAPGPGAPGEGDAAAAGPEDVSTGAPVCNYENPSTSVDCPDLCQTVSDCTPLATCEHYCIAARHIFREAALDELSTCFEQTGCDGVPEGFDDPGGYCMFEVTKAAVSPEGLEEACNALAAKAQACALEDTALDRTDSACPSFGRAFRPEVIAAMGACGEVSCEELKDCAKEATCGLF